MKTKVFTIALREYTKNVKKISFWLATLLFPVMIAILALISGLSGKALEDRMKQESESVKEILMLDGSGVINAKDLPAPFKLATSHEDALTQIKENKIDGYIRILPDFAQKGQVEVYVQAKGIFYKDRYNDLVMTLVKQNILSRVGNESLIQVFNSNYSYTVTSYNNGIIVDESWEGLIVPLASVSIYFLLLNFANSYLLFSVSEEKENRMIEIVLTTVKSNTLILGKIIAQIGTVLTQILVLAVLGGVGIYFAKLNMPIDLSKVHLEPAVVLMGIFYIIIGFLIMGNIMVAVGAAMPSYKEAQSFSTVFIMLSILPVYFFTIILADPSGTISLAASYFPLTAPMILLLRFALGELSTMELIGSSALIMFYAFITYIIAVKLFNYGALEYNKRISVKGLFGK